MTTLLAFTRPNQCVDSMYFRTPFAGVRKYVGNYFCWGGVELFVFYGFNWRWRPAEEVGLKTAGGVWGGRSASPRCIRRTMLRDSPLVWGLAFTFFVGSQKTSCALRFIFLCLVFMKVFCP